MMESNSRRRIKRWVAITSLVLLASGCPDDPVATDAWDTAFDATNVGWLLNIWGSSSSDLYAVGGTPDAGVVRHFDGESWSAKDLGVTVPLLNWTHGFGANDITIVGNDGTVVHYDGQTANVQATPTDQNLWGVWGAAPNDLWAVGGNGFTDATATILHYDGATWTDVVLPMLQKQNVRAFYKVWGTSANNVYVVGQRGVVLHYDGAAWDEELVGANDDLVAVWGTGPDNIVAVGGRGNAIASYFNGSEWTTKTLVPLPGLNGITFVSPTQAIVVGIKGTIAELEVPSLIATDTSFDTNLDLHAVFLDDSQRLTAVGGSLQSIDPPHQGVAISKQLAQ